MEGTGVRQLRLQKKKLFIRVYCVSDTPLASIHHFTSPSENSEIHGCAETQWKIIAHRRIDVAVASIFTCGLFTYSGWMRTCCFCQSLGSLTVYDMSSSPAANQTLLFLRFTVYVVISLSSRSLCLLLGVAVEVLFSRAFGVCARKP